MAQIAKFEKLIKLRVQGKPVSKIVGKKNFWKYNYNIIKKKVKIFNPTRYNVIDARNFGNITLLKNECCLAVYPKSQNLIIPV